MDWLEVVVTCPQAASEVVTAVLGPFSEHGVVVEQLGDPDDLEPRAMLPEVRVKIYIEAVEDHPVLREKIQTAVGRHGYTPTFKQLAEADWAHAWKAHYTPFRIGERFWIQPSWIDTPAPQVEDLVLHLDPGMAFGTGLHATTQLCLRLLEELLQPGMRVLDLGSGSGILALAAAQLGAAQVDAFDNDRLAVTASAQNVARNGVAERVTVAHGTLTAVTRREYDLALVNILAVIIIPLLREEGLLDVIAPHGRLVLSGIVQAQLPEMTAAITAVGGEIEHSLVQDDWVALVVKKAAAGS